MFAFVSNAIYRSGFGSRCICKKDGERFEAASSIHNTDCFIHSSIWNHLPAFTPLQFLCQTLIITYIALFIFFCSSIAQSINAYYILVFAYQSQLAEFRSFEGQDMYTGEKIVPIKVYLSEDLSSNFFFPFRSFGCWHKFHGALFPAWSSS